MPEDGREFERVAWRPAPPAAAPDDQAPVDESAALRTQITQMQQHYEQKIREAQAAGRSEGEEAGRTRGRAEIQPVLDRLARSVDEVGGLRARLRSEAEADLVQLAVAIARRILRREIAIDPDALHGLILGALEKLKGQEITRVRVHPSQATAITECLRQTWNAAHVEVVSDPSREPGAVILETPRGNLDAGVESQLQEIERGLADCLRRRS